MSTVHRSSAGATHEQTATNQLNKRSMEFNNVSSSWEDALLKNCSLCRDISISTQAIEHNDIKT